MLRKATLKLKVLTIKFFIAVSAGRLPKLFSKETLYVGRVMHKGSMNVGYISPSCDSLIIAHEGEEYTYTSYEVLVRKD